MRRKRRIQRVKSAITKARSATVIILTIRNALLIAANLAADEPNTPAAVHHQRINYVALLGLLPVSEESDGSDDPRLRRRGKKRTWQAVLGEMSLPLTASSTHRGVPSARYGERISHRGKNVLVIRVLC
jgi:hypothetical protein